MVVSSDLALDNSLDSNIALLEVIPEILEDVALDVAADFVEPGLMNVGATAPPRDDRKFVWSTNPQANRRAQAWWFANLENIPTDGRHYERQGASPYGFDVDISFEDDMLIVSISNKWGKSNMIFGNLQTGAGQLPGHRDTGWNLAAAEIVTLLASANNQMVNRMQFQIAQAQSAQPPKGGGGLRSRLKRTIGR